MIRLCGHWQRNTSQKWRWDIVHDRKKLCQLTRRMFSQREEFFFRLNINDRTLLVYVALSPLLRISISTSISVARDVHNELKEDVCIPSFRFLLDKRSVWLSFDAIFLRNWGRWSHSEESAELDPGAVVDTCANDDLGADDADADADAGLLSTWPIFASFFHFLMSNLAFFEISSSLWIN